MDELHESDIFLRFLKGNGPKKYLYKKAVT